MRISKIGWLAAVIAVAAVIGAVAYTPKPTQAAVESAAKNCVATATVNVLTCTLTVNDPDIITGSVFNVVLTGPAVFGTAAGQVTVAPIGGLLCTAAVDMLDPTNFRVTFTGIGCALATGFVVTEQVTLTGAGLVQQTVAGIINATGAATVTVNGPAFVQPAAAATPTAVTKVCTTPAVTGQPAGTAVVGQPVNCVVTVTFPATPGGVIAQTATVNLAGATFVGGLQTGTFNVPAIGAAGGTVTFNEVIVPTAAGVLPTQNIIINGVAFNAVALGGIVGVIAIAPIAVPTALTPTAVTKACTTAAVAGQVAGTAIVGQPITCTVSVTFPATPGGVIAQTATVTLSGGLTFAGGATTTTFTVPAVGPGGGTVTFTETIIPTVATTVGGAIPTQNITINGVAFNNIVLTGIVAIAIGQNVTAPAVTTIRVENCAVVAGSSTGIVVGTATSTGVNVTPGGSVRVSCVLDIDDNSTTPEFVSSGVVSVTVGNNAGGQVTATAITANGVSGTVGNNGETANVVCGRTADGAVTVNGCDRVTVEFTVLANASAPFTRNIQITANYVPDETLINTPAALASTTVFTVNTVVAVVPAATAVGLRIVCSAAVTLANASATPLGLGNLVGGLGLGQISGLTGLLGTTGVASVGVLPSATACVVVPVNAAGEPVAISPGTIEVSSVNGVLLNASGGLAENLRIACGSNVVPVDITGTVINTNTCTGVRFSVLPQGVGNVELRARYEPLFTRLDLPELETSGFITFVAPTVGISLTLNPDPVAVGATGTATANLFTVTTGVCPNNTCIDPNTGVVTVPTTTGSALNGVVLFSIQDTAIARFRETGIANAGTTLNIGVTSTAAQVVRNCGAFSGGATSVFQLTNPIVGNLQPFLGGCQTAVATYQGVNPGATNIAASFIPFLPGAAAGVSAATGVTSSLTFGSGLAGFNFFTPGVGPASTFRVLQVAEVAPTGVLQLATGCNNITPTVTEAVQTYLARVSPATAVRSVFEYNTATSTFRGAPGPSAPAGAQAVADLQTVTRLRPVFICVNSPATLDQPPA